MKEYSADLLSACIHLVEAQIKVKQATIALIKTIGMMVVY